MKKKKGGTKSRTRKSPRRRRISGVGTVGSVSTQLIAAAGGAIASKALNGIVKNVPALNKNKIILPALKGVGAYFMLRSNEPLLQNAGIGVAAEAGLQALEAFAPNVFQRLTAGPVSGIGAGGTKYLDLDDMQINRGVGAYGEEVSVGAYGEEFEIAGVQ